MPVEEEEGAEGLVFREGHDALFDGYVAPGPVEV
jgi:hypothetical protein